MNEEIKESKKFLIEINKIDNYSREQLLEEVTGIIEKYLYANEIEKVKSFVLSLELNTKSAICCNIDDPNSCYDD